MTYCINCERRAAIQGYIYCVKCKKVINEGIKKQIEAYKLDISKRMKLREELLK